MIAGMVARLELEDCGPVAFVDLVGSYGWKATEMDGPMALRGTL